MRLLGRAAVQTRVREARRRAIIARHRRHLLRELTRRQHDENRGAAARRPTTLRERMNDAGQKKLKAPCAGCEHTNTQKTATYAERFARAGARDRDDVAATESDGPRDRLNDCRRLIAFLKNGLDLLREAGLVELPDGPRNVRAGERHLVRL